MYSSAVWLTIRDYALSDAKSRDEIPNGWHLARGFQACKPKDSAELFERFDISVTDSPLSEVLPLDEAFRLVANVSNEAELAEAFFVALGAHDSNEEFSSNLAEPIPERGEESSTEEQQIEEYASNPDSFLIAPVTRAVPQSQESLINQIFLHAISTPETPAVVVVPQGIPLTAVSSWIAAHAGSRFDVLRFNPSFLANGPLNDKGFDLLLDSVKNGPIITVDCVDTLLLLDVSGMPSPASFVLSHAVSASLPLPIFIVQQPTYRALQSQFPRIANNGCVYELPPLSEDEVVDYLEVELSNVELEVDEQVRIAIASPATPSDNIAQPELGILRLNNSIQNALLRESDRVTTEDLTFAYMNNNIRVRSSELVEAVKLQVKGQDHAVELTAKRLALTSLEWDLNPERPNGVFLFAGPSGVGKTQLAKALCEALYGDANRLIRLDMSEYHQEWAVSRLTGPQPGYVGSDSPENWLTTRVQKQPRTVILLDEIEKAHPKVWNVFLQVFDAGRLTDSAGAVADFSDSVVIMTSNLGASSMNVGALGFGNSKQEDLAKVSRDRVQAAIEKHMPPELVNRLDAVIPFQPLSPEIIESIARMEIDKVISRLASHGYFLTVTDEAVAAIASAGYEPAFGARHVHRAIEEMLLLPLPEFEPGSIMAHIKETDEKQVDFSQSL